MAVERYGSKTDVVVKLILVFFISLLSFSIGTFVGKKFSDNQHKISQLEPVSTDRDDADIEGHAPTGTAGADNKDVLSAEELASLSGEFVADEEEKPSRSISSEHSPEKASEKAPEKSATDKPSEKTPEKGVEKAATPSEHATKPTSAKSPEKHEADKVAHVAEKVAEGKAPTEGEKHVEKKSGPPTTLPKEVAANANGKFTVQVASYPKEDEAQGMATDLKNKGFTAFYIPAKVKGQTWFRVSVGLFTTQKEAQAYRDDLLTRAKVSSAIVQKIAQ